MPKTAKSDSKNDRVSIINSVRTPLGFFVLGVLVVEAALGGLAAKGPNQLTALYGMFFFLAALIAVVAILAVYKPEALHGRREAAEGPSKIRKFSDDLSGYWWEAVTPAGSSVLSVVEMSTDSLTETVKMKARAYDTKGDLAATWESMASCINLTEHKVFYYWKGRQRTRPNDPFEGFGEVSFYDGLKSGDGVFSDTNLTDLTTSTQRTVNWRRPTDEENQILKSGSEDSIVELVKKRLNAARGAAGSF